MANPKWEEQILVVEVDQLFEFGDLWFQGVQTNEGNVKALMENISKHYTVKRRGDKNDPTPAANNMEINEHYKQPIPYVVLRRGKDEVFLYKRLGGEVRLQDQLSIGVGGHMNKLHEAATFGLTLSENMYRELGEELKIDTNGYSPEASIIGFINDDENEVGKHHIGILVEVYLPEHAKVEVKETDSLEGDWVRVKDLTKSPLFESLEAWSQIAAKEIKEHE